MWLRLGLLLSFLLCGCSIVALKENEALHVDSSGISDDLAQQFAVSDKKSEMLPPDPPPVEEAASGKGKKGKGKKGSKTKNVDIKTAPAAKNDVESIIRRGSKLPFSPGERTVMAITYLGVEAGTLDLRVMPYKYVNGRKVFHFRGQGLSSSVFALFYRVNDTGESFMDFDGLYSYKFQLKIDESRQQRDLVELYDQKAKNVHYWEKMVHDKKGLRITQFTQEIETYTQDAITAAFYLRTLPLEVGKSYSYPMVSNGKPWMVTAKVLRKEKLVTPMGTIPAIVIEPETRFEGVLKSAGNSYFWLSDDEHRNFLKIDAKVKIGSVIAYLKVLEQGNPHAE